LLNGDRAEVAVNVRAEFQQGSFEVLLEIVQTAGALKTLLLGDDVRAAKELLELVGLATGGAVGLFQLVKWLRGRQPQSTTTLENGNVKIEVRGDGNHIEVRPEVVALYRSPGVTAAVK